MINPLKFTRALEAIHGLIIESRIYVGEKKSYDSIFEFIDELEYLPTLILQDKDLTNEFNDYLLFICEKYKIMRIYNKYIQN